MPITSCPVQWSSERRLRIRTSLTECAFNGTWWQCRSNFCKQFGSVSFILRATLRTLQYTFTVQYCSAHSLQTEHRQGVSSSIRSKSTSPQLL